MSDKTKKILGIIGFALAIFAGAIVTSPLGDQPTVKIICDIVLKILAPLGFTTTASAFAKAGILEEIKTPPESKT